MGKQKQKLRTYKIGDDLKGFIKVYGKYNENSNSIFLDKICPFINGKCIEHKCMYYFEYEHICDGNISIESGCEILEHIKS